MQSSISVLRLSSSLSLFREQLDPPLGIVKAVGGKVFLAVVAVAVVECELSVHVVSFVRTKANEEEEVPVVVIVCLLLTIDGGRIHRKFSNSSKTLQPENDRSKTTIALVKYVVDEFSKRSRC